MAEVVTPPVHARHTSDPMSREQAERRALTVQPIPAILVIEFLHQRCSSQQVQTEHAVLRPA
jgi:hypothetical protein